MHPHLGCLDEWHYFDNARIVVKCEVCGEKLHLEMGSYIKLESPLLSEELSKKNLLISAINLCDVPMVKKCIEQGANVNDDWLFGHHTIFTKAVEKGNLEVIKYLLHHGANVNSKNKITPLIAAIRNHNSLSVIQLLVENGADIDESDNFGRTPLNEALTLNKTAVVKYLIKQGVDVNRSDGSGRPPIVLAVANNNLEVVELLVSRGANIHTPDNEGNTALVLAQRLHDVNILHFLEYRSSLGGCSVFCSTRNVKYDLEMQYDFLEEIQLGEEATEKVFRSGRTAEPPVVIRSLEESEEPRTWRNAIVDDDLEEVKRLAQTSNVNQADDEGCTPLSKAVELGRTEIVTYLLTLKVNTCKASNGKTPLLLAVQQNDLEMIELLLQNGAELTLQTAFFEAVTLENVDIVKYFLQREIVVNLAYKNGYTPLTKSIQQKNLDIVKLLVEHGADVNMSDKKKNVPLVLALEVGDVGMVTYLAQKGALVSDDLVKKSHLEKHIEGDNLDMVKIFLDLLQVPADVVFDCGYSLLTKAVELRNLEMVKYLVRSFSVANSVDGNGRTAIAIAASNQDLPILKYLLEAGADTNLAREEIEECRNSNEDFALLMEMFGGN